MEQLGIVGANYRTAGSALLARLTVPKEERLGRLPQMAAEIGVSELLYLATCNRVEVVFKGDGQTTIDEYRRRTFRSLLGREARHGEAERTLYAWGSEGAVEHLFLVASGLDSAQAGEREIRAQVREALSTAREAELGGTLLDFVVTKALRVALEVHRLVLPAGRRASLADIALEHLNDRLHRTPGRVALVGVSPMSRHCGQALAADERSIVVVNRTAEAGLQLARELGAEAQSLADFRSRPPAVEAVLLATGSPQILLGRPELERLAARTVSGEPPLVIDMSVPITTDREAAEAVGLTLLDLDGILAVAGADRTQRLADLAPAREIVDESLARLRRELAERLMSPVIAHITRRYRETAVEGVNRLLGNELGSIGDAEREALRRWAEVIARRFAHIPIMGLREMAAEFGAPVVKVFLEASGEGVILEEAPTLAPLEELGTREA